MQSVAAGDELRTAIRLLQVGLRELQAIDGANDFVHLPLLTLASGLERFLKITICFAYHHEHGAFPDRGVFKKGREGHDLELLLAMLVESCFTSEYRRRQVAQEDFEYITRDPRVTNLVQLMSRFAQSARYHDLDIVLGGGTGTTSPEDAWSQIENEIVQSKPDWQARLTSDPGLMVTFAEIDTELVARLERLLRAIARLYTIGPLGQLARRWSNPVYGFVILRDEQLGTRTYGKPDA